MRATSPQAGTIFCAAAALTAAAVMDPIVEALSNAGTFGPGPFTDHSNVDVIPAMCVAAALALLVLVRRLRLFDVDMADVPLAHALPKIFPLQIAMLFCMEGIEQIGVTGHLLGGSIWLGGPAAVSLAMHALACVAVTWGLSHLLRWSARTIVCIVRAALEVLRRFARDAAQFVRAFDVPVRTFTQFYSRALRGRAPPVLPAPTQ